MPGLRSDALILTEKPVKRSDAPCARAAGMADTATLVGPLWHVLMWMRHRVLPEAGLRV